MGSRAIPDNQHWLVGLLISILFVAIATGNLFGPGQGNLVKLFFSPVLDQTSANIAKSTELVVPDWSGIPEIVLAAEALHYAHQQNVIHLDIKPGNIMYIPESATIKITDFGIARITDSSKTKIGIVLGTPSYMSPEQLTGNRILNGRADLFSLGVTFSSYSVVNYRLWVSPWQP